MTEWLGRTGSWDGRLDVDGNAIAGMFQEVFAVKMTCGTWRRAAPAGQYTSSWAPGSCCAGVFQRSESLAINVNEGSQQ
jgi:hypothetical protein